MKLTWEITPSDVVRVRQFLAKHEDDAFVKERARRNLGDRRSAITKSAFWRALVGCLLTTQQRSGPDGSVARFMRLNPLPLDYSRCKSATNVASFASRTLSAFGGIRRSETIGKHLAANLERLENKLWPDLLTRLDTLRSESAPSKEIAVAEYLAELLLGLGPKQSRNLLQALGLTRYEVPIDSRLTKWLNDFGFPVRLSSAALSDPNYYSFVSEGIQQLCKEAGVYPCILDAAIFASFDSGGWRDDNLGNWGDDDSA